MVTVYNKQNLLVGWAEADPTPERIAELDKLGFAYTSAMLTEDWCKPKYVPATDSFVNDASILEQTQYIAAKTLNL